MDKAVFHQVANYRLQGSTFDAKHLSRFIENTDNRKEQARAKLHIRNNSDYFERSNPFQAQDQINKKSFKEVSAIKDLNNVRPAANFLNLNRDMQK